MPVIRFIKPIDEIVVPKGTNLMKALLAAGRPVASSCHGEGICGRCCMQIIDGMKNLTSVTSAELQMRRRLKVDESERMSCQAEVLGDVCIDAKYW